MPSNHDLEKRAIDFLRAALTSAGHTVADRRIKSFDLVVDGRDVEVKAKAKPFGQLDFITFTRKQYTLMVAKQDFDIYLVCGLATDEPTWHRLRPDQLLRCAGAKVHSYEFSRLAIMAALDDTQPAPRRRSRAHPPILKALFESKRNDWGDATQKVAMTDLQCLCEALAAEHSVEELIGTLKRQGLAGDSYRYLLKPLVEEARRRRQSRNSEASG